MKMKFIVPQTKKITFEVELPKEYEEAFLYEDGEDNPPTYFDYESIDEYKFCRFVEKSCKEITGETCDYLDITYIENFDYDW